MSTHIRHRRGTYYLVFSRCGRRVWRTLRTRDRMTAQQIFLMHGQQLGPVRPQDQQMPVYADMIELRDFGNENWSRGSARRWTLGGRGKSF